MKKLTPVRAIRAKCLDCSCYQLAEVRNYLVKKYPLYSYRMGHRPKNTAINQEIVASSPKVDVNDEGYTDTPPEELLDKSASVPIMSKSTNKGV